MTATSPAWPARTARWSLALIAGVAMIEWFASAVVYRPMIDPRDWVRVDEALQAIPSDEPVWLGTPWLEPRARMHLRLESRAGWHSVARADLRGFPRFHVLGRPGDAWSAELEHDLEGLPAPAPVDTQHFGGLALYTYHFPAGGTLRADFVADAPQLHVRTNRGKCRGTQTRHCDDGQVDGTVAEVDYRPRRCLKLQLDDGATVRLRYPAMPTGNVLRGHLGVHDFNARLRSDAPVRLRVLIDNQRVAQWLVSDAQGWWPFTVPTEPGTHDIELELSSAVRGTWPSSGYAPSRVHAPCIELRSLQEPSA